MKPATIQSGAEATFVLEIRNATDAPIVVPVPDGCVAWMTTASNGKGITTFESECGAVCSLASEMVRLTLLPGGVLKKRLTLRAARVRIAGDSCKKQQLGPLPPGAYTLHVVLPWTHPAKNDPHDRTSDAFTAPLRVTR